MTCSRAAAHGASYAADRLRFPARLRAEQRSKVTFGIEETDHGVKLTVLHEGLQPGGAMLESISGGWPIVVSRLKTLLEAEDAGTPEPAAR